jgi:hypothetical protein
MRVALGAVLAVFAAAVAGCGSSHPGAANGTPPPPPGPTDLAAIQRVALPAAASMGDPHPTNGAMGTPEPLPLAELTKGVPCLNGHQHLVGPDALGRFHAVTAVSCVEQFRVFPGQGQWEVSVRRVAVGNVGTLQRYFEQPDEPNVPKGGGCTLNLVGILVPVFVDDGGRWIVPRTPVDGCGHPLGYADGSAAPRIRWHVVSVRRIRLQISAAALASACAMGIKDEPAGGAGELQPTPGGPVFATAPATVRVCIYRTEDFESGSFVRGFRLGASQTQRLLGAMTYAGRPSGSCPDARSFAVIVANAALSAQVELGGCWRVARPNLSGLGTADAAVVRAVLR